MDLLYETMIFEGPHDGYQERYHNKVAALAGHDRAVTLVRDALGLPRPTSSPLPLPLEQP